MKFKIKNFGPATVKSEAGGAGSAAWQQSSRAEPAQPKRERVADAVDNDVIFLSDDGDEAAAPARPRRAARKRVKLEPAKEVGEDREVDAQDAADEELAPAASKAKAERKKRTRKQTSKVHLSFCMLPKACTSGYL